MAAGSGVQSENFLVCFRPRIQCSMRLDRDLDKRLKAVTDLPQIELSGITGEAACRVDRMGSL